MCTQFEKLSFSDNGNDIVPNAFRMGLWMGTPGANAPRAAFSLFNSVGRQASDLAARCSFGAVAIGVTHRAVNGPSRVSLREFLEFGVGVAIADDYESEQQLECLGHAFHPLIA